MPVVDNDILRVVAKMSLNGGDIQNVFHFQVGNADPSVTDANVFGGLNAVLDGAYTTLLPNISTGFSFDSISVYNLTQDYLVGEGPWNTLTVGGAASHSPPQNAALVLFSTNTLRSQGRKFLPPMSNALTESDGTITAAGLAAITIWAANFIGTITGINFDGVFGNWNETQLRFAEWIAAIIKDFFATQRRRYVGKGS